MFNQFVYKIVFKNEKKTRGREMAQKRDLCNHVIQNACKIMKTQIKISDCCIIKVHTLISTNIFKINNIRNLDFSAHTYLLQDKKTPS